MALDPQFIQEMIRKYTSPPWIPASVYRLQINSAFNFRQAQNILPYLDDLGVQAVYCSPYFQAQKGSMHGYDVTDPNRINPDIGTEAEWESFMHQLQQRKLGQILDVVPNHMGISDNRNAWWQDVLENGRYSMYANFFDIDWSPEKKELKDKVLLPVLGDQYGSIIENQELILNYGETGFYVAYWDHRYPIAPETYPLILEDALLQLRQKTGAVEQEISEMAGLIAVFRELKAAGDPGKLYDLNREKEIAKQKLQNLFRKSETVREAIENRLSRMNGVKNDPASFDALDQLLMQQYYRLSYWRVAAHEINYRRFFNINELAAIRVEEKPVFHAYHWRTFCLIQEGRVQGLRIDHPDGLSNPPEYFRMLQRRYLEIVLSEEIRKQQKKEEPLSEEDHSDLAKQIEESLAAEDFSGHKPLYVVVEKILDRKEPLPSDWAVQGTVGYGFLNALNGLFIDRDREKDFTSIYEKFTGEKTEFSQLVYEKKKFFAAFDMTAELNTLGYQLDQLSEHNRRYRDFTMNDLVTALREIIACFPVYRTYIFPESVQVSERDEKYIRIAVEKAKGQHPALSSTLFDFLRDILLLQIQPASLDEAKMYRNFILKFQQLSAPIMAKGLEDTVFYIYNRFLSLNEVGGDPEHFGFARGDFHRFNVERSRSWPAGFITTSTHDTKRSEDVRMRLNVLSEIPEVWNSLIARWTRLNKKHKTWVRKGLSPGRNLEYSIYQNLLGVWPDEPFLEDREKHKVFESRLQEYFQKAVREAKVHTNWLNPNLPYEEAVKKFVGAMIDPDRSAKFLESFTQFQAGISEFGKWNSLAALSLKLASPGVVDTYQGNEIWDYSLVDPDNRRPVDYELRSRLLNDIRTVVKREGRERALQIFRDNRGDGRIKMYLLMRGLECRSRFPDLFRGGDYQPLETAGSKEAHVVAFLRRSGREMALAASVRFAATLWGLDTRTDWNPALWENTRVMVPREWNEAGPLMEMYSGRRIAVDVSNGEPTIAAAELFRGFPAALVIPESRMTAVENGD